MNLFALNDGHLFCFLLFLFDVIGFLTQLVGVVLCLSQIGSGSLPVDRLPSEALTFTPRDGRGSQLEALSARWRALPTPVIGRIGDGRMWLDLRCLEDEGRFLEMMLK